LAQISCFDGSPSGVMIHFKYQVLHLPRR